MLKKINALFFLMLLCGTTQVFAQFPYLESFKNSTAPDIEFGGEPKALLTSGSVDPVGDGYLRLTNSSTNQKGYIYYNKSFSSQYGLKIDFEYFTYGGNGADGLTFFLYDATVPAFNIGGFGGSLGYAQYQLGNAGAVSPGVSGGYLGIGIDEYGNFSNPIEARQGGVVGPVGGGLSPSSVTLRGKGNGNSTDANNYKYLIHKKTTDAGLNFNIAGGGRFAANQTGYRRVFIDLQPHPVSGYNITVKIMLGGVTPVTHTVINNYYYPDAAPALVRYGLASSTGNSFNFHEIRNLRINAFDPIPPVANDDLINETPKNTAIAIPVLNNDTDLNGNIDPAGITITSQPVGSVTINPLTGIVTYTPVRGFVGTDTFKYKIKDLENAVSNEATVRIQVKTTNPIGVPDNSITTVNTPVNINVMANDLTKVDVIPVSTPTSSRGGTTLVNTDGTIRYTPPAGQFGNDTFTYKLKDVDVGLESAPILVTIRIDSPPIAVSDRDTTLMEEAIIINVVSNDTDADGTIDNSTVVIKNPPVNGTITNTQQGNITYTPKNKFAGIETFTYTVKDDKGFESLPATVTVLVKPVPKIGLAKALPIIKNAVNGAFIVRFTFTIGNYGIETLEKISLKDDLAAAFPEAEVKVMAINPTGSLKANSNYNGIGDIELLNPSSTLAADALEKVELVLNVVLLTNAKVEYENNALAEGYSTLNGEKTTDESVQGEKPDSENSPGDVSIKGPTKFNMQRGGIFIPQGFSPNNDGINDLYIISNSAGKTVKLDVFNRWGNRVYKSAAYQNDWDGKCKEGIYIGQDLPVGTYYYIIIIDDVDKHAGYITINR